MRPKFKKAGDKVEIVCPECDGLGTIGTTEESPDTNPKCEMCNGIGKVTGVISAQ